MTDDTNPGFTAEENAAWAEMSGQAPPAEAPVEVEAEDVEVDDLDEEEEAPEAKQEPEKGLPKTVPHKALHAERERRKAVEAEAQKLREFKAVMEDRFATLQRLQAQPETPAVEEDPEPDPNVDIFAHNAWLKRQFVKTQEFLKQRDEAERQQREAVEAERAVWSRWDSDRAAYAAQNEKFNEAADYLAGVRAKQLAAFGYNRKQTDAEINRDLAKVVVYAHQNGKNAAEIIYNIAVANGFSETAATATPAAPPMPTKLANVEKAKAQSTSLSQAGGRSANAETTAEDLAAMPQDEFAKWIEKPANAKLFRKMMGG